VELFQVTIKRGEDIQAFYDDMETPGGNITIPDRQVECGERQPVSRTTGYLLTMEEAMEVAADPRVEQVMPQSILDKRLLKNLGTYPGRFDKGEVASATEAYTWQGETKIKYSVDHRNWGILRHTERNNRTDWGTDAAVASDAYQDDTVTLSAAGNHVDIVIVDLGVCHPNHEDYEDRFVDYNWGQHFSEITGGLWSNYTYSVTDAYANFSTTHNFHATACASYAAGKLYGPAGKANVYSFGIGYEQAKIQAEGVTSGNGFYVTSRRMWNYIQLFHRDKPINPITGRKNPTIVNASIGSENYFTGVVAGSFRGSDYGDGSTVLTEAELIAKGIYNDEPEYVSNVNFLTNVSTLDSDLEDAINAGIIVCSAAGNENRYTDAPGGLDYDNWIVDSTYYGNRNYEFPFGSGNYPFRVYYHRGDEFARSGAINVGALGHTVNEAKAVFDPTAVTSSAWGPGVDVYAAGRAVIAGQEPRTAGNGIPYPGQEQDTGEWDTIGFSQGTSYATPLAVGFLACLLEIYPKLTQSEVTTWVHNNATTGVMYDAATPVSQTGHDRVSIDGSDIGRVFYWKNHKKTVGNLANNTYGFAGRPASGAVYPRVKKLLKG